MNSILAWSICLCHECAAIQKSYLTLMLLLHTAPPKAPPAKTPAPTAAAPPKTPSPPAKPTAPAPTAKPTARAPASAAKTAAPTAPVTGKATNPFAAVPPGKVVTPLAPLAGKVRKRVDPASALFPDQQPCQMPSYNLVLIRAMLLAVVLIPSSGPEVSPHCHLGFVI
jgi:hypothetical protein